MRWMAISAGLVLAAATAAFGEPLAGSSLPADTRWVLHADVEGARQTKPLWEAAQGRLGELPRTALLPRIAVLERITGMKVPEDLKDVTIYSQSFDEAAVCLRIHGTMNAAQVSALLKSAQDYKELQYAGHTVMQWHEKTRNRTMYVTFARPDLALLSASLDAVEVSLDTLEGKAAGLKADSPLAPAAAEGGARALVWLAAKGLGELPRGQAESPVLTQIDAASVGIRWANDALVTDLRLTARSDQTAQQLKALADGIKAFVLLSGADEHAAPALRILAGTMEQFTVQIDGRLLKGSWAVGIDKLEMLLNVAALDHPAGSTKPATAAGDLP